MPSASDKSAKPSKPNSARSFRAPKGTRDAYPVDALKRRYITQAWRNASIRHGFDEIEGPTFEHLDLYTQKSGDEIVSQLFSFRRAGGDDDYALRPEFTPTLARMYAARANSLPTPTKWFTAGPYFRAEKPQRGRLREFLQWNCDIMGDGSADADAELIASTIELFRDLGLDATVVQTHVNDRRVLSDFLVADLDVSINFVESAFKVLDKFHDLDFESRVKFARDNGVLTDRFESFLAHPQEPRNLHGDLDLGISREYFSKFEDLVSATQQAGLRNWCTINMVLARGLAYYTGMVFEVIAEGERAICGGGRYDNLIELFGGPPTPAVGFGMGDVVLSLLLQDKGLMPEGKDLLDAVSMPQASARPDAFLITANEELDPIVKQTVAALRAGTESEAWLARADRKPWDADRYTAGPLHARRTYKSTRNIGKLLKDATNQHARSAVIIQSEEACNIKNLDTGEQREAVAITDLATVLGGVK